MRDEDIEFKSQGKPPEPKRLIRFAHSDGLIYELTPTELVVLRCIMILDGDTNPDRLSRVSGLMAAKLCREGWFTAQEYAQDWANGEIGDIDAEWEEMNKDG